MTGHYRVVAHLQEDELPIHVDIEDVAVIVGLCGYELIEIKNTDEYPYAIVEYEG